MQAVMKHFFMTRQWRGPLLKGVLVDKGYNGKVKEP